MPRTHLLEIYPKIIHPSTRRSPQWSLPSGFPNRTLYAPSHQPRATFAAHLILLDFFTCTLLVVGFRQFSSSLFNLLHSPLPNPTEVQIFSSTPFLKNPQLPFLPCCQRPSFTPIQNNRQDYISVYLSNMTCTVF